MIYTRRVYDKEENNRTKTFLVDRIWPRGIKKTDVIMDGWLKEAAPSDALRRWFHIEPHRWTEFKKRYYEELDGKPEEYRTILEAARDGDITLLYGSKDVKHNNAIVLKEYIEQKLK